MLFGRTLRKFLEFVKIGKGYVFALTLLLVPIILLGSKYLVDKQNLDKVTLLKSQFFGNKNDSDSKYYKICAKEAALAVAKKWHPALTYKQQKGSMLRIADDVYNKAPTSYDNVLISEAVPGLNIALDVQMTEGKSFNPTKIKTKDFIELTPEQKQIPYETKTMPLVRYNCRQTVPINVARVTWYGSRNMHLTYTQKDISLFTTIETDKTEGKESTDSELFKDFCLHMNPNGSIMETESWYLTVPQKVGVAESNGSDSTGKSLTYTERKYPEDDTVEIMCENDKIKVITDNDVGYAVPAECNVDIVLALPINAAASNKDNQDLNTPNIGLTYNSSSTTPENEAKSTPIYQISRAYQKFLKDFFYTRGVNVGVIPYSGNISITTEGSFTNRSTWLTAPDTFNSAYFLNYDNWNTANYERKYTMPKIMGAMLYGTYCGGKSLSNNIAPFLDPIFGLLCRGKTIEEQGNRLTKGDLLSIEDPSNYKFRIQNYNSCYLTNVNLLSLKCEGNNTFYYSNPYYLIELNSDLLYIYYMLTTFYPYNHDRNQSNFIFIPVTWCNNLFQKWSATGENVAVDTSKDKKNLGRLSTPSKMEKGRKKVLILTVNKPDWFEPGELTYLGFDNDYSDTPAIESDMIRFDIDYSDTSRRYEDGSKYDGTIQGQKKILKYETVRGSVSYTDGYYQCVSGTGKLTYSQKYLIRLVVGPKEGEEESTIQFTNITPDSSTTDNRAYTISETQAFYIKPNQIEESKVEFNMQNIKLISAEITNRPHTMVDGKPDFGEGFKNPERSVYIDMMKMADDGKFKYQTGNQDSDQLKYGGDTTGSLDDVGVEYGTVVEKKFTEPVYSEPTEWSETKMMPRSQDNLVWSAVTYGAGYFVAVTYGNKVSAYFEEKNLSLNTKWVPIMLPSQKYWKSVSFGGGYFVAVAPNSDYCAYIHKDDLALNAQWSILNCSYVTSTPPYSYLKSVTYGDGYFVAVSEDGNIAAYIHKDSIAPNASLTPLILPEHSFWCSVAYGKGYFVAVREMSNKIAYIHKDDLSLNASWTGATIDFMSSCKSIAYGSDYFVVVGTSSKSAYIHVDNLEQEGQWIPMTSSVELGNIVYGDGYFISTYVSDDKTFFSYLQTVHISPGGEWIKLSSSYKGNYSISTFGVNYFIAVDYDNNNFIYANIDFDSWLRRRLPARGHWRAVTYGGGYFVAVSEAGYAAHISKWDLESGSGTWTLSTLPGTGLPGTICVWGSVSYGGGYFVAVANESTVSAYIKKSTLESGDAKWEKIKISSDVLDWNFVVYGDGYFVAVARCYYSDNKEANCLACISVNALDSGARNWTKIIDSKNSSWYSVSYGSGYFVVVGSHNYTLHIKSSTLGEENCIFYKINLNRGKSWRSVTYGNDYFVAIGSGENAAYIKASTVGYSNASWTEFSIGNTYFWNSVVYGDGYFLFLSSKSTIAYVKGNNIESADTDYSLVSLPSNRSWRGICYSWDQSDQSNSGMHVFITMETGGPYIALSNNVLSNSGPTSWSEKAVLPDNGLALSWRPIAYGDGYFVTIASSSSCSAYIHQKDLSKNVPWSLILLPEGKSWGDLAYGEGYFIAVSSENYGIYMKKESLDSGEGEWILFDLPEKAYWNNLAYGNGYFVAAADNSKSSGYIKASSIDTGNLVWNLLSLPAEDYWSMIAYGDDCFVVGSLGDKSAAYIRCSYIESGGTTWTKLPIPPNMSLRAITYGDGYFVGIDNSGSACIKSADLKSNKYTWTLITITSRANWGDIVYGDGYFFSISFTDGYAAYIKKRDIDLGNTNWVKIESIGSGWWTSVDYGNGYFVAVNQGSIYSAHNFLSLNNIRKGKYSFDMSPNWYSVTSGEGYFVAIAYDSDKSAYIKDSEVGTGVSWIELKLPISSKWSAVTYGDGYFVAISEEGNYAAFISKYELDTGVKDWHGSFLPSVGDWCCVTYGEGYFVAVMSGSSTAAYIKEETLRNGTIFWSQLALTGNQEWSAITYANGYFVIVANNSEVAVFIKKENLEDELVSCYLSSLPVLANWISVTYGGGYFVAIAQGSNSAAYIAHKSLVADETTWSQLTLPMSASWISVTYGGDYFVTVTSDDNCVAFIQKDNLTVNSEWIIVALPEDISSNIKYRSVVCCNWDQNNQENLENLKFIALNYLGTEVVWCDIHRVSWREIREDILISWYLYNNKDSDSTNHHFFMNYPSDMYFATYADPSIGCKFNLGVANYNFHKTTKDFDSNETTSILSRYLGAGIYRTTRPFTEMFKDTEQGIYDYKWEVNDIADTKIPLMYAGVTLPINIVLYYGASGSSDHAYAWQSDSFGKVSDLDPNEAVKKVTKDACAKLKADWGSDLRIYLIKFRVQEKFRNKITQAEKSFDYDYLSSCASGKAAPYVYDIKTEEQLKNALSEISADIKSWADAQEARNI